MKEQLLQELNNFQHASNAMLGLLRESMAFHAELHELEQKTNSLVAKGVAIDPQIIHRNGELRGFIRARHLEAESDPGWAIEIDSAARDIKALIGDLPAMAGATQEWKVSLAARIDTILSAFGPHLVDTIVRDGKEVKVCGVGAIDRGARDLIVMQLSQLKVDAAVLANAKEKADDGTNITQAEFAKLTMLNPGTVSKFASEGVPMTLEEARRCISAAKASRKSNREETTKEVERKFKKIER